MELINETSAATGWTMGFGRDGREFIVVAIKATFTIPSADDEPELAKEQFPLVEADRFTGEPGFSSPLYESDYAHHRPMCDVLLNGSAYAPLGRRVSRLSVGLRVGQMVKAFAVVGHRVWQRGVFGIRASDPEPFDVMPISYDVAFGGIDKGEREQAATRTFLHNPVGRGYSYYKQRIDGRPMPNTEEETKAISDPSGAYVPMSFGAIGRSWQPRARYAGTYDQEWLDERAPFWPDDFDYRYFQSAPPDQQIAYPRGGEDVVLSNLTPQGHVKFKLPRRPMPVWFLPYQGKDTRVDAALDTIVIEPDSRRFMLVWRAVLPMRRSCFDIRQAVVGATSLSRQRARKYGKPYYKGLAELVRAKRGKQ